MLALVIAYQSPLNTWIAFSCVFAPFGALIRWRLSSYNIKVPKFPVFTFLVNFVGSLLLAAFEIGELQLSSDSNGYAALSGAVTVCILFYFQFIFIFTFYFFIFYFCNLFLFLFLFIRGFVDV
jgi:hypothetical protein